VLFKGGEIEKEGGKTPQSKLEGYLVRIVKRHNGLTNGQTGVKGWPSEVGYEGGGTFAREDPASPEFQGWFERWGGTKKSQGGRMDREGPWKSRGQMGSKSEGPSPSGSDRGENHPPEGC